MSKSSAEVWLWLLMVMQPYNPKTNEILAQCGGDATAASKMVCDGKFPFLSDKERKRAEQVRLSAIRPVLEMCAKNGIRIVTLDDDEYPNALREIVDPPILLFTAGSLKGLNEQTAIAAVGARNVSDYGRAAAEGVLTPLAKMGITIVSGLAVGSDSAAHRAALTGKGRTIGVLGCGILVNYPAENAQLKRDIVNNGGAVISELLPTARTYAAYFRHRNRIISGLCSGTLIIEAGEKSGSLLTAAHAVDQGREVFCIPPHDIFSKRYSGVVPLLREGAVPVFGYTDIVERLLSDYSDRARILNMLDEPEDQSKEETRKPQSDDKQSAKAAPLASIPKAAIEDILTGLQPDEAAVLKAIAEKPAGMDELVERCGMEYSALSETITNLELFGHVTRGMDGSYSISI